MILRGIEQTAIFRDDRDRRDLAERIERLLGEEGSLCYAWAFMSNHVHLVVRSGPRGLSRLMARMGTGYAQRFNIRHERAGHLFQNRFKSFVVSDDSYAQVLVRYVHINPIQSGEVKNVRALETFPWTGHAELMGLGSHRIVDTAEVLSWFGSTTTGARQALSAWMGDADATPVAGIGNATVHGQAGCSATPPTQGISCAGPLAGWDFGRLLAFVCEQLGADERAVRSGRRTRPETRARAIAIYLAKRELGIPLDRVRSVLSLSSGAASRAFERGRALVVAKPLLPDERELSS